MDKIPLIAVHSVSNGFVIADHSDSIMTEIPAMEYVALTVDEACLHVRQILLDKGSSERLHEAELQDMMETISGEMNDAERDTVNKQLREADMLADRLIVPPINGTNSKKRKRKRK